jgi:hypothetical protein
LFELEKDTMKLCHEKKIHGRNGGRKVGRKEGMDE